MADLRSNLAALTERVRSAAVAANRDPATIEVMAVTKTHPRSSVLDAYEAGIRLFGENRVAEARQKYDPAPPGSRIHLVGHLERNKARDAAALFDAYESIDKLSTVEALLRHLPADRTPVSILVEVNTSGEPTKYGVAGRDELFRLVEDLRTIEAVSIDGLMTVGPFTRDEARVRAAFASLRDHLERLRSEFGLADAKTLSMGMSNDFEWAIAEGATRIRVGTILFGARDAS